ncbi:MAG: hypothetical protein HQ514_11905 [Rhodospirillales bacterium]|nr:hypothetical protein [Rhodospirillales bacterium]
MSAPPPRLTVEAEPFIPYADMSTLPDKLKAPLEAYEARMGFMPNALKLYGHRPEILALLVQLNNVVMRDPSGHLDQGLKRRIGAYCSRLNGCTYCTAHNCGTLKTAIDTDAEGWGFTDDDISELLNDDYVPDGAAEKACFDYAKAASTDSSNVPDGILHALAEHLTPPQVVELGCLVGFWKMYNTIHDSLHVPLEQNLLTESGWVDR